MFETKIQQRFDSIDQQLKALKELIVSTASQSGQNLQAAAASLASKFVTALAAVKTEIQDFKDTVAAELNQNGVSPSLVDTVTAGLNSLGSSLDSMTAAAQAADPGEPLAFAPISLPSGQEGVAYSASITTTGGKEPVTITSGDLPAGLAIDSSGNITGTPAVGDAGSLTLIFSATDSAGNTATATASLSISAAAVPPTPIPATGSTAGSPIAGGTGNSAGTTQGTTTGS